MATSIVQHASVVLPGEPPWQRSLVDQSTGLQIAGHDQSDPARIDARLFVSAAALPQWELTVQVVQLLGLQGPCWHQVAGTWTPSIAGVMALSESVWASCSWWSEGLFGQSFSIAPPIHSLRGLPCLGPFSAQHIRHIEGPPLSTGAPCRSVHPSLKGAPWVGSCSVGHCTRCLMGQTLYCSAANAGVWGERLWWCLHPLRATQQYCLASMTVQLSSTGISHHSLPPHIP